MESPSVLILDNLFKISQLYAVSLETYVGCRVIPMKEIDEALTYIQEFNPDIVITRGTINERDIGHKIQQVINEKSLSSKLIVIGKTSLSAHHAITLEENVDVKVVIKNVANLLGVSAEEMAGRNVGDFYRFHASILFPKLELICDIFTKSKDGHDYQIFLEKGSMLSKEILKILEMQNHTDIYVKANDRLKFVNTLMMYLSDFLADDQLNIQDTVLFANQAYKVIREAASKLEITPEVILMTETNINTMMSIVNQMPKINKLIEITTKSSDDHFKHSLLISYVANHIVSNLEWGTNEQKVKLTFVSFFHNITLPSELILLNSDELVAEANIPVETKEKVNKHALQSAIILSKFKSRIPFGVDTIIKQHHGSRDGIGFTKYPQSISPLALIFMIADEWVTNLLNAERNDQLISKEKLLNIIKSKYKGISYNNIITALEKLN